MVAASKMTTGVALAMGAAAGLASPQPCAFVAGRPLAGSTAAAPARAAAAGRHSQQAGSRAPAATAAALGAASVALARGKRRSAAAGRGDRVPRRFFDFGGPKEEVDPRDPGRQGLVNEYQADGGSMVDAEESEFGWAVVTRHNASEQDGFWPGGSAPGEVKQEWRELRLANKKEVGDGTGQSVVKVSLSDGADPVMVPYCMTLGYTKSMCCLALTGAHIQGALPLDDVPKQRALVVGLGAGSMPVWLDHTFPDGRMVVDALEIDPAVVAMATGAMGFPKSALRPMTDKLEAAADAIAGADGQPLRMYTMGAEEFVEGLAVKAEGTDYKYDMVFIDAFDKAGKVPPCLVDPEGVFLQGLAKLLNPKATVVMNLLIGMTGSGSSGGPREIEAMVGAVNDACVLEGGEVFTVRTPIDESTGNQEFCFLRSGRAGSREEPLKEALIASAAAVNEGFPVDSEGETIRYDFSRRFKIGFLEWQPEDEKAEKKGGGGLFDMF